MKHKKSSKVENLSQYYEHNHSVYLNWRKARCRLRGGSRFPAERGSLCLTAGEIYLDE